MRYSIINPRLEAFIATLQQVTPEHQEDKTNVFGHYVGCLFSAAATLFRASYSGQSVCISHLQAPIGLTVRPPCKAEHLQERHFASLILPNTTSSLVQGISSLNNKRLSIPITNLKIGRKEAGQMFAFIDEYCAGFSMPDKTNRLAKKPLPPLRHKTVTGCTCVIF